MSLTDFDFGQIFTTSIFFSFTIIILAKTTNFKTVSHLHKIAIFLDKKKDQVFENFPVSSILLQYVAR